MGGAELGVDGVGVAGRGLLEAVGGDGSGLCVDGALALGADALERFESVPDVGRVEPGFELRDGDVVVVADVEDVDVGGEEVAEERRGVEGRGVEFGNRDSGFGIRMRKVGEYFVPGAGVLGLGSRAWKSGVDRGFGGFELGVLCDHGGIVFEDRLGV